MEGITQYALCLKQEPTAPPFSVGLSHEISLQDLEPGRNWRTCGSATLDHTNDVPQFVSGKDRFPPAIFFNNCHTPVTITLNYIRFPYFWGLFHCLILAIFIHKLRLCLFKREPQWGVSPMVLKTYR